ncbi:HupE/UreJ family protein [Aurantiacibacter poecillastricola]|uniref:HupE/UreJ family protein n=1 Tax=Aurantiacibacter poecillastricola TaxID=3064385 RepID=UPI00273CF88B|nr:HupE/UreJ family protein [Aurantiacibacter sp. 219JJ12-13]MDP5262440.1 HupE/UreJ family protein [Aurantiacibacter sp. 219JJ12-13]
MPTRRPPLSPVLPVAALLVLVALALPLEALAHDVAEGDKAFVRTIEGPAIIPFMYLGAKHMVTGYDHIAFLIGVVFFLRRLKDVLLYVSAFAIGHSITLIGGVLLETGVNAYIVDAIIGVSVIYKGVENIGGFEKLGWHFDTRIAVLVFGLFHGLGLATKVLDLEVSPDGLLANLIAFNVGVELGQILVLTVVVLALAAWRHTASFKRYALYANIALILVGIALTAYQLEGYFST